MGIFEVIREEQDAVKSNDDGCVRVPGARPCMYQRPLLRRSSLSQLSPTSITCPGGIPVDVAAPVLKRSKSRPQAGSLRYDLPTPDATLVGLSSTEAPISTACRHTMAISGWNNSAIADY